MASDPHTLERLRRALQLRRIDWYEKRMFGGDCFMVDDKMLLGTYKGGIMARVDPAEEDTLSQRPGAEAMIHGGRAMPGFLMVAPEGFDSDTQLEFWIGKCMEYNPKAKSSKKKK